MRPSTTTCTTPFALPRALHLLGIILCELQARRTCLARMRVAFPATTHSCRSQLLPSARQGAGRAQRVAPQAFLQRLMGGGTATAAPAAAKNEVIESQSIQTGGPRFACDLLSLHLHAQLGRGPLLCL